MVLKQCERDSGDQRMFENDVKMYGTQTRRKNENRRNQFENDVKMYGTQTFFR